MTQNIQRNSRGGPKTEEGKKRSSQNSIKTGMYSREIVLPQENAEDFDLLYVTFICDLNPQDIVGQTMVRDLVGIIWKQMRLDQIETKVLIDIQNGPLTIFDTEGTNYLWRKEIQALLPVLHLITEAYVIQAIACLTFANGLIQKELSSELEKEIASNYPLLHELLNLQVPQCTSVSSPSMTDPNLKKISILGKEVDQSMGFQKKLTLAKKELAETIWAGHHKAGMQKEHDTVKQKRLLEFMERPSNNRAHDDLRRSFTKTMAEYRRHEAWRLERAMLDMGEALID